MKDKKIVKNKKKKKNKKVYFIFKNI